MSNDLQAAFAEAVLGIGALKNFPYDDFAHRLHNKVRMAFESNTGSQELRQYIEQAPNYPPEEDDPGNFNIDIFYIYDLLHKLSIPSASDGISSIDSSLDSQGLKKYVSQDNSEIRYLECLTNLLGFCLGEHINFQLRSQGRRDIDELWHLDDFQDFCLQEVKTDQFILLEIRKDMKRHDHLFSIAWLLIADYMQDRDHVYRTAPASGTDFESKASYKTLNQWSYTLWANEGKGNPDKMDEIVTFCGRVATIGLCPPNPTTGLQSPAPAYTVMRSFYDMGIKAIGDSDYQKELQDSLDRLQDQEDIINEWQSYCQMFSDSWRIQIRPYWNTGFYRAFGDRQWDPIRYWEHFAYEDQQDQYYWGVDYLPVVSSPAIGFTTGSSGCSILPEVPITLSDGTSRPVEAISPADRILTNASSKTSVPLGKRPLHKPDKAKLIGFNGEKPSILSSQVFHTPTGLRAVDAEAAQSINPHQRIGKLAVGHIVFRLQGGEYAAVEIKSIEQLKESTFDRIYNLVLPGEQQTYHVHGYLVDTNSPSSSLRQAMDILRKVPGSRRLGLLSYCKELWSMFQKFEVQSIYRRLNWELFGQYNSPDGEDPVVEDSRQRLSFEDHIKTGGALSTPKGVLVERLTRGFSLTPHHPSRIPAGYELPSLGLVDGYLLVQDHVQLRSTYDPRQRCFRWTRELQKQRLFEHGVIEIHSRAISGTGVIYLSSESEAQDVSSGDQDIHPFEAHARSLETLNTNEQDPGDEWHTFGQYHVTLDQSVWPPEDPDRTEPEDPVDGGVLEDGFLTSPDGVKTRMLHIPLLEQLRDQINQQFGQNLGAFYKVIPHSRGELDSFTVIFNRAPLIPFISDAGLDVEKTFRVGFQSDLGIDVTLPVLYQQMTITFDYMYYGFTGYLFEYDPTKRGYKGNRHLIIGEAMNSPAVDGCRSKISHAYTTITKPGVRASFDEKLQPAPVTKSLLNLTDPSIPDLVEFAGYDEKAVHNDTQLLVRNMMYYHMDTDQRENILREPKPNVPEDLPSSLADNLPSDLKTFFKEKYAPAFICRYVGRTQKYAPSFTQQEMKDLWYWWEGNGKSCLSQSKEYNDVNRLSSREAMKRRYEKKLEPYLNDNPDKWAEDLYNAVINNTHLMETWVNFPMQGDNNVVNKQCNILDALSPSIDRAQSFFNEFMDIALKEGVTCAEIEGGDQDQIYKWIHDSMGDLIVAILNGDDSISAEVREALLEDINDFEEQNGLNQQADAQQRAAAILEKSTIFMTELSGWMSSVGKGLQAAFGGTAMFKWAGEAFDQIAAKFASKLPGVDKLKGLSSACMVGVSLATAAVSIWGLVGNWDSMTDSARATVIIEVIGMVLDAADNAMDAFKAFKSKPASTAEDALNTEAIDESLLDVITDNPEKLGDVAQEISGDEDYRTAIGDGIQGDGIPMDSEAKEGGSWNEELGGTAEDVPPGYEDAAKKFNISGNLLRILNAALGIGLVVAMSFSLASDWNSLSDPGKVLGVLNIIVQGVTVLLDIVDLGAEAGLFAVTGTMSVALPILGAVLAVVGIILMIVQMFINLFIGRQEPPDPIRDFVHDVAHDLIAAFGKSPESQLDYTLHDDEVSAGRVTTITIEGANKSSDDVTLSHITIGLYSGNDNVCLFENGTGDSDTIQLVTDTDSNRDTNGYTYVAPSELSGGQLPTPARLGNTSIYYRYDLQAAGPPKESSTGLKTLILKQGESFKSVWTGTINKRGNDDEKSASWIELVEVGLTDKCQMQFMLRRI